MKTFLFHTITCLFVSTIFLKTNAKPDDTRVPEIEKCARLEGGFVIGSRFEKPDYTLKPGGILQYSYCLKSGQYLGFGLGAGVHFFKDEGFIPFYLDMIGLLKRNRNSPFVDLQVGYALGWNNAYNDFHNPEFRGGFLMGIGVGKKIRIDDRFAYYLSVSYKHQLASIRYDGEMQQEHFERLHYHLFIVSIGLMLEQE